MFNTSNNIITSVSKNINREIKIYIDEKIDSLRESSKLSQTNYIINNFLDEKFKLFDFSTYNNKYLRKVVKNYELINQKYFNYIVGGTINLCKIY